MMEMILDRNKKMTLATIKSFMKKALAKDSLFVKRRTAFDGMCDGVVRNEGDLIKLKEFDATKNDMGTGHAIWFVFGGRDMFNFHETPTHYGIEVYNCCGSFYILTEK